jgi:aspartate kinase
LAVVVQKFGGSSVATAERITAAARRAIRAQQDGNQVVVVVSARGDTTDELIELAQEITENPPSREMDMLLSTGEQISIALTAMAIHALGQRAMSFTGPQIGIVTDSTHTKARIKSISTQRIRQAVSEGNIVIVAGFQGMDENDNITTLGRGGSDTTAVALAAVVKHDPASWAPEVGCEIYTDVDGIYTTDPRVVPEARKMATISYDEMLELASLGAGVMHSRSIEFAKKFDVPLQVRSSFSDAEGTWIVAETEAMRQEPVCGAAIVRDEARITIAGVPDQPGVSHRIFSAIAGKNIVIDMIAQSVGVGGKAEIGFTVLKNELASTLNVLQPIAKELGATLNSEDNVSKVSIVGAGMRTHTGVAEKMFATLATENINIKMITTGDIKISVLVDKNDGPKALRAVHQAFELAKIPAGGGKPSSPMAGTRSPAHSSQTLAASLSAMEDIVVTDVILDDTQGRITVHDLPDKPGMTSRVFAAVAQVGIVVDVIVQNVNDRGTGELSFSVPRKDVTKAVEVTKKLSQELSASGRVTAEPNIAKVSIEGVGMRTHTGMARRMFGALADRGINIAMINTSETRISVVVELERGKEASETLKSTFDVD